MPPLVIYNLLNNVSMELQFVFNDYIKISYFIQLLIRCFILIIIIKKDE